MQSPEGDHANSQTSIDDIIDTSDDTISSIMTYLIDQKNNLKTSWKNLNGSRTYCDKLLVDNLPIQADKNRYVDVIPFDHSRVKLPAGVYINASVLKYDNTVSILTQDPLKNTIGDYFRMLSYHCVTDVIDLVGSKYFNCATGYDVKMVNMIHNHDVIEQVVNVNGANIHRFQYMKWDDHKVPESVESINYIIDLIGPGSLPVINCSAGIGRSGTFWVAYMITRLLKRSHRVCVYDIVQHARNARAGCVQTFEQYEWLHDFAITTALRLYK